MHLLFRNTSNKDSKCNWVMDSLYKGWPNSETADRSLVEPLPGHFWGFIENNEYQIGHRILDKIDWYFWDMPYYGRWSAFTEAIEPNRDFYWRVSKNSVHYSKTKDYPSDRFKKWNVEPKTRNKGSKILICPSSPTMTRWITGKMYDQWINDTVNELKQYTDRPIEIRHKPRGEGRSGPDVAEIPFWKQAEDCHCIVTCISICAVEAQLMGIPTISDARSFASDISSTVLEAIENPKQVDTSQWFYNLAYSQFTHKEIESGFAYEIMKNA